MGTISTGANHALILFISRSNDTHWLNNGLVYLKTALSCGPCLLLACVRIYTHCHSTLIRRGVMGTPSFYPLYFKHYWGSATFCADPDPTPDQTYFFSDFKDAKNNIFSYFFLITCQQVRTSSSVWKAKFFAKLFVLKFYFAGIFSVRWTHLWEKGRIRILTSD